jgi:hypothetical protein
MSDVATFNDLMNGFGVVTVMNACIYKLKEGKTYVGRSACQHSDSESGALKPSDFYCTGLYLDTLKIANFTQEGPTKTITGGQYANPLIKYGKTMTCEMQDALGRAATMVEFFGCEYDDENGRLSVTDKFPGAFALEGDTFFINQKTGEKENVHILIPQFLPDAILTLTQDAEGDATVFDLNGTVSVTTIQDEDDTKSRDIFYEIRTKRFFEDVDTAIEAGSISDDYHSNDALTDAKAVAVSKYNAFAKVMGVAASSNTISEINDAEYATEEDATKAKDSKEKSVEYILRVALKDLATNSTP